jgi:hypothetical protein
MHLSASDWAHVDERAQDFTGRGWVFERVRTFLASNARLLAIGVESRPLPCPVGCSMLDS